MKLLILGGSGMLGHQLVKRWKDQHQLMVTFRSEKDRYQNFAPIYKGVECIYNTDVSDYESVGKLIKDLRPEAVINAVGVIKQRPTASEIIPSLEINALLPHKMAQFCEGVGARFVQISTDCVFSGKKGMYTEEDVSDAYDIYGRTKFLGEVHVPNAITLRSSIIGLELFEKRGLMEWFLAQQGAIKGFRRAIYSGFTTQQMSKIIDFVLTKQPNLTGLIQVASAPINKFDLLVEFQKKINKTDVEITPFDDFFCDRSLNGSKFVEKTGYAIPTWTSMLEELAQEYKEGAQA